MQDTLKILSICILVHMVAHAGGEPYGHEEEPSQLESVDNYSLVDKLVEPLPSSSAGQTKQMKMMKYPMEYSDYDYYLNARRGLLEKDTANKMAYGESNRPAAEYKSLPWYGGQSTKPIASMPLYPSRSYDPYIRRYDRFDEQYHRSYPQYFEDMYMHRQRFDPYDSYSPRVPQYPDPYVMYPDRYLDTPTTRDYLKSRRAYIDDNPAADSFNINSKYSPRKLPDLTLPVRNERVVYYAHLPEIVRTPYDINRSEDRNSAALTMSPSSSSSSSSSSSLSSSSSSLSPYKLNKKKIKNISRPLANNSTNYKISL